MTDAPGGVRVLVVDDRSDAGTVVASVLNAAGFEVAVVAPGATVVRALRDETVTVCVVALPPGTDERSAQLVSELRRRPEPQVGDVALVVLVDDPAGAAAATVAGADLTVARPVEPSRLVAAVTEVSSVDAATRRRRRP
ncbi:MAG: response regulator [Actinomycetes bacterium]